MHHPCPGAIFQSSLLSRTAGIASVSPKQSVQTNHPSLHITPHLGYNTILGRRSVHDPHRTSNVPSQLQLWPTQSTSSFRSTWSLPSHPDSAHFSIPSPLPQESPARTSIIPNQALGSSPGTVPSTIQNTTQNDTQLAPSHDPLTVRLGRGLQLLRWMTRTVEFPQMAAFTTPGSLEQLATFTTTLDLFVSHYTRK